MAAALLWVLATIVIAAPLALAVVVDRQARRFQLEAFGHLQRAARNLRLLAWTILAFYVAVMASAYAAGDLHLLVEWPLSWAGFAIYLRIGAAIVGYVLAYFVARELYLVTRPGKLAPGAPNQ